MYSVDKIQVFIRVRPQIKSNKVGSQIITKVDKEKNQINISGNKIYYFDKIFDTPSKKNELFHFSGVPFIKNIIKGYDATILAYGQSGSEEKEKELPVSSFQVSVSFLELYNDEINDLLLSDKSSSSNEKLKITRNKEGKIEVNGLLKKNVEDAPTAFKIFNSGINKRCVGATDLNAESSRSHIIFSLYLTQINEKMGLKDGVTEVLTSKFNFVDLTGTERLKRTNGEGNTAKEGKNINNCLLHLENVISALSCKDQHIPYRNSKLTHLLQDSLGGNSKTLMIACISPSNEDLCEIISTLNYASRA
ncbi:Kinesin-like protein KIF21B [Strongyloides ratti]|uniref:Kinesin-like protein KIF21B n=1 Tax=Strongyloides ratti TaxID=34506 RepID=A0A090LVE4_STRRB|nr:Kinesin-like protein KIF21B [Strongyloides ratti]CEF71634.1 Kinesin-like protein KIF21B [Strongyloides ratti]